MQAKVKVSKKATAPAGQGFPPTPAGPVNNQAKGFVPFGKKAPMPAKPVKKK